MEGKYTVSEQGIISGGWGKADDFGEACRMFEERTKEAVVEKRTTEITIFCEGEPYRKALFLRGKPEPFGTDLFEKFMATRHLNP